MNDIRNVRTSIKIVSPFLISELINFRKRNLEVQLITTDNIEDFYGSHDKNIHKLIIQNRETDKKAVEKREKWKDISKILTYLNSTNKCKKVVVNHQINTKSRNLTKYESALTDIY